MGKVILKTSAIFLLGATVFSMTFVPPPIGTDANFQTLDGTSGSDGDPLTIPLDVTQTKSSTADLSTGIDALNTSVEALKEQMAAAANCECSAGGGSDSTSYSEEYNTLSNDVVSLTETTNGYQTSINSMQSSVTTLTGQFGTMTTVAGQLSDVNTGVQTITGDFTSVSVVGVDDMHSVSDNVHGLTANVNQLSQDVASCSSQCATVEALLEDTVTVDQLTGIQTTINVLQETATELEGGVNGLATSDDLTQLKSRVESTESESNELTNQVTDLTQDASNHKTEFDALETKVVQVGQKVTGMESNVVTQAHLGTVETNISGMETRVGNSNGCTVSLATVNEFGDRVTVVGTELSALTVPSTSGLHESVDVIQSDVEYFTEQHTNGADKRAQLTADSEQFYANVETRRETIFSRQSDINNYQNNELQGLQTQWYQVQVRVDDNSDSLDSIHNLATSQETELDVSNNLDDITTIIASIKQRLDAIREANKPICRNPFTYVASVNLCYYVHTVDLIWQEASVMCEVMGGTYGRLISIDSEAKRKVIAQMLKDMGFGSYQLYVGLTQVGYKNDGKPSFVWPSGIFPEDTDTKWNYNQPDAYYLIQCGQLWNSGVVDGHMLDDYDCEVPKYSICDIPMNP